MSECVLLQVADWLDGRGLILNAKKTQVMIIQPPNHPPPDARILCRGTVLEVVESVRYLGLQIDNDLKWSSQIARVERKSVSSLVPCGEAERASPFQHDGRG